MEKTTKSTRRFARQPKTSDNANITPASSRPLAAPVTEDKRPSKIAAVVSLLERANGATLAELVAATGWLPHTTRAALTGLKKKDHVITKNKRDDVTCYRIAKAN